jgi:hypothetical protein
VFSISIANIKKVLIVQKETDSRIKLLKYYSEFLSIFNYLKAKKLLLLYSPGTNYIIELEKVNRKEPIVPWDPLYNISRDKLIVLRKTLMGLLNK